MLWWFLPSKRRWPLLVFQLSNGHSPANLSNSSTRQKFAIFVEFEYSPKWSFWKIGWTRYIRRHSPTCFGRTRYIRRHSPNYFARTRQTRERQVWQLLHEFSEFGEFSECRLDRFIHIKYVICALNDLSCLRRHSPTCFGRTRYIHRHSPTYFARTRYIRRHSPTYFARTRQTRPHSAKGFFEINVTRLDTFARVIRHSGKFGASGHCLLSILKKMIAFPEKVGAFVMKTKYVSCLDGARFFLFYLVTLPAVPRMLKFFVQYRSSWKVQ